MSTLMCSVWAGQSGTPITTTRANAVKNAMGTPGANFKLYRCYYSGMPSAVGGDIATADAVGFVRFVSCKPSYTNVGSDNAAIRSFAASLQSGDYVTCWHEPENDMTAAQYVAVFKNFYAQVKTVNSNLIVGCVFMSFQWGTGRNVDKSTGGQDAWYVGANYTDFLFTDTYTADWQHNNDGTPRTLAQHPDHQRWHNWAKTKGKPLGLAEFGCHTAYSDSQRAAWMASCETWLQDNDYRCVIYWNDTSGYTVWPSSSTTYPLFWNSLVSMFSRGRSTTTLAEPVGTPPPPPPPPDVPPPVDSGPGVDPGTEHTYLDCEVAGATVDVDLHLNFRSIPPDQLAVPRINITGYHFATEDYLVVDGIPTGNAPLQCRMTTELGLGDWTYTDAPPAPGDINIGATARWLPTAETFLEGDGWTPYTGDGFALITDPVSTPYLDTTYSFEARGGDEVELPAVVFTGDAWMSANDLGWTAQAFTFGLVAVLHANPEGPNYGIVESTADIGEDDPYVDWGVRYTNGSISFFAGAKVVSHQVVRPQARPVVILVSLDAKEGRLLVADRNKSSRSFATDRMKIYDAQLYLGRQGTLSAATTADMDVLEFAYWDHGLNFAEMAEVLHDWDSIYGIVG